MQSITVSASREYKILVGPGILDRSGAQIRDLLSPARAAVITDETVSALYLERLTASLSSAGIKEVVCFAFPPGEASKTLATAERIYTFLSEAGLTRSDLLVALGGGVVGDVTGFVASTYLRGVRYVQIPTTLLAQVDSSVGGKTAVDLPSGKNQVGTFWQPHLVLCDTLLLDTLTAEQLADGMAEVLKYGLIRDRSLFRMASSPGYRDRMEAIIARCIEIKRDIVQEDEFDTGPRMLLNFGHTLGHAAEQWSAYAIPHGKAVAMGMIAILRASAAIGKTQAAALEEAVAACRLHGLPTDLPAPCRELAPLCRSDKKRTGGTIHVVVVPEIGRALVQPMELDKFNQFVCGGNP